MLEDCVRERIQAIDAFNREAPTTTGLTLRVNGRAIAWPADVERLRVLLGLVVQMRRKIEAGDLPTDAEVTRLTEEVFGVLAEYAND